MLLVRHFSYVDILTESLYEFCTNASRPVDTNVVGNQFCLNLKMSYKRCGSGFELDPYSGAIRIRIHTSQFHSTDKQFLKGTFCF